MGQSRVSTLPAARTYTAVPHRLAPIPTGAPMNRQHLSAVRLTDPAVLAAQRTLLEGGRLGQADGLRLYDAPVIELGRLANAFARDRNGDRVFFTVNRQLNPT